MFECVAKYSSTTNSLIFQRKLIFVATISLLSIIRCNVCGFMPIRFAATGFDNHLSAIIMPNPPFLLYQLNVLYDLYKVNGEFDVFLLYRQNQWSIDVTDNLNTLTDLLALPLSISIVKNLVANVKRLDHNAQFISIIHR